jgi:TfoX/Sxy family transcriptional regulator of competence genes
MKWKKANPELSDHLESALAPFDCDKRKMFGHPAYFVDGNMFAGIFGDDIFIRLSEGDQKKIFSESDEAAQFEPLEGRVMREYVVLPQAIYDDDVDFEKWLSRAYEYAIGLPPKKKKKAKR